MRTVRLYYDVVCPYSYMESHAVEAAEDAGAVEVEWLPFELRPAPRPLLEPRGDHLRVDWTRHVYRRAQELGIEIHLEAESAGVSGVPALVTDDGETHWGMGGLQRLLEGLPLVPRA